MSKCFGNVYISDGAKTALSTHGWEAFNQLLELGQVRGVIKALQTFVMVFLTKLVSNVSLKMSTICKRMHLYICG